MLTIPSRTALQVALRRAAHQIHDVPLVFEDPLAVAILGDTYAELLQRTPTRTDRPFSVALRAFLVARSRYAEDTLKYAVENGVEQYVLLGAGLDTFAYRNPHPHLLVFEVDHPQTQAWKRELLRHNRIDVPDSVVYTPVDFESQSLAEQLRDAGFDHRAPSFFAWLGVVPYLTTEAFRATLTFISSQPRGSGLTFDYVQPSSELPLDEQRAQASLASRVEKAGEPFRLFFAPEKLAADLTKFHSIEDLGAAEINARYFAGRSDQLAIRGSAGRFLTAWL